MIVCMMTTSMYTNSLHLTPTEPGVGQVSEHRIEKRCIDLRRQVSAVICVQSVVIFA